MPRLEIEVRSPEQFAEVLYYAAEKARRKIFPLPESRPARSWEEAREIGTHRIWVQMAKELLAASLLGMV